MKTDNKERQKRYGIVFGNGSSIDDVPDRFFYLCRYIPTIGLNLAPLCLRFQTAGFRPKAFCMLDSVNRQVPIARALKGWDGEVDFWIDRPGSKQDCDLKHRRRVPSIQALKFTAEQSMLILAGDYQCNEIVMIGCEGFGPYHRTRPTIVQSGQDWDIHGTPPIAMSRAMAVSTRRLHQTGVNVYAWPSCNLLQSCEHIHILKTLEYLMIDIIVQARREKECQNKPKSK
jgi:hypothetical protein